jgi:hypothetical protein
MSYAPMLRHFPASSVLIAIRSTLAERYVPRPGGLMHDPWWGADFDYATAWVYAPVTTAG